MLAICLLGGVTVAVLVLFVLGQFVARALEDKRRLHVLACRLRAEERLEQVTRETLRAMRAVAAGRDGRL